MPQLPGLMAMPTVVFNAALSLMPDRSLAVRGPDRVAIVSPMYNEELGAGAALSSILGQQVPPSQVLVSINGGSDRTAEVVAETLADCAYLLEDRRQDFELGAEISVWERASGGPPVTVLNYSAQISKASSINRLLTRGLVQAERFVIVDGDTVLDPGFVAGLRDHFYRLKRERRGDRWVDVIEDVALQSGVVFSRPPKGAGGQATWISAARSAEYAFSTVVRLGQTRRIGHGRAFGSSRLYTAVGCGFSVRADAGRIPTDTQTEDHDLSLKVQNGEVEERMVSAASLHHRGFKVVVDGVEVSPLDHFKDRPELLFRRTANARLVPEARMHTDDPLRVSGYAHQVERWTGGGIENALKRVLNQETWAALRANVRFTVVAAQLENLLGLLLMLALPVMAGLNAARPDMGLGADGWRWWLLSDLVFSGVMVFMGYTRLERTRGSPLFAVVGRSLRATLGTLLPLIIMRPVNAACYLAACARAVPEYLRNRLEERQLPVDVTWQRPRSLQPKASVRTAGAAATMLLTGLAVFSIALGVASYLRPGDREVYRMIYATPRVEMNDHLLPMPSFTQLPTRPLLDSVPVPGQSLYCRPGYVPGTGEVVRSLADGAPAYTPLSPWGLLTLARLTPILVHMEEAASAYDVSAELLLRVLINESYLDPLAEGQTGDLGLSQVTSDALTLLRAMARDRRSPYANAYFFAGSFSVFDPDFSICAGAAKMAWAGSQPGGEDERMAYARYINPFEGVVRGAVSERHQPLVEAMIAVKPMAEALAATVAAFRADPASVSAEERALLNVSERLRAGEIGLPEAYAQTAELARAFGIKDLEFYQQVLEWLYPEQEMLAQSPSV